MPMLFDRLNYLTFLDCVSHFDSCAWEMEYFPPYQSTTDVTVIDNCSHDRWWAGGPGGSQEGKNTCHPANITEKTMAPHSSTLAWKIPWTEEPGRLQSLGSLRVGVDWVTSLSLFTFMHWRRKWKPTPVFLLGEFRGWRSLVGCLPSMGSHRVGHDWSDLAAAAANIRLQPLLTVSPEETGPKKLRWKSNEWLQWVQTLASSHI